MAAILIGLLSPAKSQEVETWLGLEASKELSKDVDLGGGFQARAERFGTSLRMLFGEVNLGYKINKHIRLKANYRYSRRLSETAAPSGRHRANLDLSLKTKKKPFIYALRVRWQEEYSDLYNPENYFVATRHLRFRPSVSYGLNKKHDLSLGAELFQPLNNRNGNRMDGYRIMLDLDKDLKNRREVSFSYLFQQSINSGLREYGHVLKVEYSFGLK